jgi:uncharacterized protein (TIGR02246 family)
MIFANFIATLGFRTLQKFHKTAGLAAAPAAILPFGDMANHFRAASAVLLLLATLSASPATGPFQQPSVALPAELARVLRDYENAWSQKSAAGLAGLFVEDGFVLSPGNPIIHGRQAIEGFYRGSGGGPLALRAVAFATNGNVGYIIGGYAVRAGEPDRGKFTLALRRASSGRWLIVSDMDNGNSEKP